MRFIDTLIAHGDLGLITYYGQSGSDTLNIDFGGGDPIPAGLSFFTAPNIAGKTPNALNLIGLSGATVTLGAGSSVSVTSATQGIDDVITAPNIGDYDPFAGGGSGTLAVASGTYTFTSDLGNATSSSVAVSVASGATANFAVTQHLASLNIASGGTVAMLPAGGQVIDTDTLSNQGRIDLANNDLIVNDPLSSSDSASGGDSSVQIQEEVASGYYFATSSTQSAISAGIIYSSMAVSEGMALGVAPAADMSSSTPTLTLDGQNIPSTAVVARYTIPGDTNLDGEVNGLDFNRLAEHFGLTTGITPPEWYEGDLNYNGVVNVLDFNVLAQHFGNSITNAIPGTAYVGVPFSVTVNGYGPGFSGLYVRYDIDWGDGTVDSYPGSGNTEPLTFFHTYTTANPALIQIVGTTEDIHGNFAVFTQQATPVNVAAAGATVTATYVANFSGSAVTITADGQGNTVISGPSGDVLESYPTDTLLSLNVSAGQVIVDYSNGDPLPVSGLFANAPAVSVTGGDGDDTLITTTTTAIFGNSTISGSEIRFNPYTQLTFANAAAGDTVIALAGNVTISGDGTTPGPQVVVDTGATAFLSGSITLSNLTVLPGGLARLPENGANVLTVGSLDLATATPEMPGGILDLSDNDMIIQDDNPDDGTLTQVNGWLAAGYDSGVWDDEGVTSGPAPAAIISVVSLNQYYASTSLGVARVGDPNAPQPGIFDGQPVADGNILVRFTWVGDLNLDGVVNVTDETIFEAHTLQSTGWSNGDINYDGHVSELDAVLFPTGLISADYSPSPVPANGQYDFVMPEDFINNDLGLSAVTGETVNWGDGTSTTLSCFDPNSADYQNPYHTYSTSSAAEYSLTITVSGVDQYGDAVTVEIPHQDVVVTPDAPTGLTVTESTTGEVDLSWSDDTAVATGYVVTATPTDTSLATKVYDVPAGTFNASATGLTPYAVYAFNVVAVNTLADGVSSSSSAATATATAPGWTIITTPNTVAEGATAVTVTFTATSPAATAGILDHLSIAWGDSGTSQTVTWPLGASSATVSHTITATETSFTASAILYDVPGHQFTLTPFTVAVVPTAPDTLTGVVASSTEVDLTWVDHSANAAFGDIVYASTDGGSTFNELTEVDAVAAGATNTYAATDLTPGTPYQFYVAADDGYAQSAPSNTVNEPTTFVPPDINVQDSGTVVEGQPYELDLTATFENGEPDQIDGWWVDWHDGAGGSSDVVYYPAATDPTVAVAAMHPFAAGTSTATPTISAVDQDSRTFTATADMVVVSPLSPVLGSYCASGNSVNVSWTNNSRINTDTEIALSSDSAGDDVIAGADAGATNTSFNVADLDLDTQYWVSLTATTGDGGFSDPTTPVEVTTPYVAPTLDITPAAAPTESGGYSLNMSASYAHGTPQQDLIGTWSVDWGDGRGVQTYTGETVQEAGVYAATATGATISITATDTNGHACSTTESIIFTPNIPTNLAATPSSGDTSATVTFTAATNISGANYVIERFDPVAGTWSAVTTLPATADGSTHPYTYVDNGPGGTGLTPAPGGLAGGYLYRVAAQGASCTATAAGSSGLSAYTPAVALAGSSGGFGFGGPHSTSVPGIWSPNKDHGGNTFQGSQEFTTTVTLPAHMGYSLTLGIGGSLSNGDTATLVGSNGINQTLSAGASGFIGFSFSFTDQNTTTTVSLTLTVNCVSSSDTYYVGDAGFTAIPGTILKTSSEAGVELGGQSSVGVVYGGTSVVSGINLTAVSSDPSIFQVVTSPVATTSTPGSTGGGATFQIEGVAAGQAYVLIRDAAGDQVTEPVEVDAPLPTLTLTAIDQSDMSNFQVSQGSVSTAGTTTDLYVGSMADGNAEVQISGSDGPGSYSGANIGWTITAVGGGSSPTPSSGTFANGPVTVTLDPDTTDYLLTATDIYGDSTSTNLHNIHITAYKETISSNPSATVPGSGNTIGAALDRGDQAKNGVYIPFDTLDEDYDNHPDFLETTGAGGQPPGPVQGDTLMSPITIPLQQDGFYQLRIPRGFAVFEDKIGTTMVGDGNNGAGGGDLTTEWTAATTAWTYTDTSTNTNVTTAANGTSYVTLWIEAIGRDLKGNGSYEGNNTGTLILYYNANNAGAGQQKDSFKLSSFTWTGAQDVPDNSTYLYNASGGLKTSKWSSAVNGTIVKLQGGDNKNLDNNHVAVNWKEADPGGAFGANVGGAFGEVVYQVNNDYQWEFPVNVVHVAMAPANNGPNKPINFILPTASPAYVAKTKNGQDKGILVNSVTPATPPANAVPAMQAQISMGAITGPRVNGDGPMRGVQWIVLGMIQQVQTKEDQGTYHTGNNTYDDLALNRLDYNTNTKTSVSNWHIDGNAGNLGQSASIWPWFDSTNQTTNNSPNYAAYANWNGSQPTTFSQDAANQSSPTLGTQDSPAVYGAPTLTLNGGASVVREINILVNFKLTAAVATTVPDDPQSLGQTTTASRGGSQNVPQDWPGSNIVSDGLYTARATAKWFFNGSGQVTVQQLGGPRGPYDITKWTPTAGTGTDKGLGVKSTFTVDYSPVAFLVSDGKTFANQIKYGFASPKGLEPG